jgi:hypothetical protein
MVDYFCGVNDNVLNILPPFQGYRFCIDSTKKSIVYLSVALFRAKIVISQFLNKNIKIDSYECGRLAHKKRTFHRSIQAGRLRS